MNEKEFPPQSYPKNHQYQDDDIQLIDYLRVIWRWKWLIIGGALLCAIVAAIVSFQMPKIYQITMTVEPPVIGVDSVGRYVYAGSGSDIMEKITQGAYTQRIKELLTIKQEENFKFETNNPSRKKGNFIYISSRWSRENIDLGLEASKRLIEIIKEDCLKIVHHKLMDYERQITMKENEIKKISLQRKAMEEQIKHNVSKISRLNKAIYLQQDTVKTLQKREKEVALEIEGIKKNTIVLEEERKKISMKNDQGDSMTLVLYFSMIQQDSLYLGQWNEELRNTRTRIWEVANTIEELRNNVNDLAAETERIKSQVPEELNAELDDIKAQLNTLQLEKGIISNIMIIQEPEVSSDPVKPKIEQMILIAGVAGFMFFVFLAFLIEYIKNASKE